MTTMFKAPDDEGGGTACRACVQEIGGPFEGDVQVELKPGEIEFCCICLEEFEGNEEGHDDATEHQGQ